MLTRLVKISDISFYPLPPMFSAATKPMNRKKLLGRLSRGELRNVAFEDVVGLVGDLGSNWMNSRARHHIFKHPLIVEMLNLQDVNGEAKPYQIRQFLRIVERHNLRLEDDMKDYHINIFYSDEDEGILRMSPILNVAPRLDTLPKSRWPNWRKPQEVWLASAPRVRANRSRFRHTGPLFIKPFPDSVNHHAQEQNPHRRRQRHQRRIAGGLPGRRRTARSPWPSTAATPWPRWPSSSPT